MVRWKGRLSLAVLLLSCGHQEEAKNPSPGVWEPPRPFEVECDFGITGCESQASESCGYAGFHVLGSYKTQAALGWPRYRMLAACGPPP